ncbi:HemX protein, partial [Xanthomonas citri pv. citri]|nr:HemX protein [Xanthomonas citri pv. citri]
ANEAIEDTVMESGEVSDSIEDWQKNIEKSASSFLDHFIRVSDRNKADEKAFVAPNQEVYLRENIRLRLQIAILAIPRQQ